MRAWNEFVAAWGDVFSLPLTVMIMLLGALLTGTLWYFWPRWWHALRRMRLTRRRREQRDPGDTIRHITDEELDEVAASEEELPDVAAAVFTSLADRYAAEGRFAEAVRERLRAMVRELADRGALSIRPGWTVTELAQAARLAPLTTAASIFSLIWYAKRPALSEHDAQMRELARQLAHEMSRR